MLEHYCEDSIAFNHEIISEVWYWCWTISSGSQASLHKHHSKELDRAPTSRECSSGAERLSLSTLLKIKVSERDLHDAIKQQLTSVLKPHPTHFGILPAFTHPLQPRKGLLISWLVGSDVLGAWKALQCAEQGPYRTFQWIHFFYIIFYCLSRTRSWW